ncbi:cytochrome c oxidase assembly protein [Cellulomonas sp. URHE0023]|uniref:cytochrome c oxidase assembly protein n=1 Tax=Cellulomonas sp. URHE0023 TaxID=1380354 RepID=UPI000554BFB9|nr:cytochrome c oxidase assembly protein [Cellulomonas sp. URHE0023]
MSAPATSAGGTGATRSLGPSRVVVLPLAAVAFALLGIWFSGAALATVLRDPGPVVRWALPASSTLSELAGSVTLGALFLAVGILPRVTSSDRPARAARAGVGTADGSAYPRSLVVAGIAAGVWTLLSIAHLVLTYADVAGQAILSDDFGQQLGVFLTEIDLGRTLLLVTTVAAVVTALSLVVATPTGAAWTGALVLVALYQQAQLGHAAGASGHSIATSSMVVHLVGAAVWIGSLAALALLVARVGTDLSTAVARYSVVAGWCFVAVGVSGLVNGLLRTGGWSDLTTTYGVLLLAKAALFGVLGLLGLAHRRRVLPRLGGGASGSVRRLGGALFWRLVLVELVVMGAVSGVAVALGATAPPVPEEAPVDPSPAYLITGHPLPPEPTPIRWITEWRWDLVLAFAAGAGLVVYWRWVLRLRRRGDQWSWVRAASWTAGVLLFAWATNGAPNLYGHVLFSGHMIQHMTLAMLVPVFIVLSAPVTLALRALPVRSSLLRSDDSRGPREWILVLVHSHAGTFLANPLVAAVNFIGSMVLFYYSGLFEWSLRSDVGHLAMVVHFTLAGYLFVNGLIGVDPGPRRWGYPQRLLLLFGTMVFHAFFGVTLVTGEALFVADWFGLMGRPWGASAIADQQAGGAFAWGIGELPTLVLAIVVAIQWSRDDERVARRRDRRVDRDGDVEMDEYNAMLANLAARDAAQPPSP